MSDKWTAFLSSTSDLEAYRSRVGDAIHRLDGWDWQAMEWFGASPKDPERICREKVAQCHLYVGIIGYTYGSMPPGKDRSYCEIEFETAIDKRIPCLLFLASDTFAQPAANLSREQNLHRQKLFRERIEVGGWCRALFSAHDDLAEQVLASIYNWRYSHVGGDDVDADTLEVQDAIVARAIRAALHLGSDAPISLAQREEVPRLNLSGQREFGDAGMSLVRSLSRLERLNLWGTGVTDAGIRHLRRLPGLEELDLRSTAVSDGGLEVLADLTELWSLGAESTAVTHQALENLKGRIGLRTLNLARTQVSRLGAISTLTGLEELVLDDTPVPSEEFPLLANLANLRILGLSGTRVTDAALAALTALPDLRRLNLSGTSVTDAGMERLAGITTLQHLYLKDTQITSAGLQHLARLRRLEALHLSGTTVDDISSLTGLPSLTDLEIDRTPVLDISPLHRLRSLRFVVLPNGISLKETWDLIGANSSLYIPGVPGRA